MHNYNYNYLYERSRSLHAYMDNGYSNHSMITVIKIDRSKMKKLYWTILFHRGGWSYSYIASWLRSSLLDTTAN